MRHRITVVVTAAGSSNRMALATKKEYLELNGIPVLVRATLPFARNPSITTLWVTVPRGHVDTVARVLRDYVDLSRISIIEGGETRQDSVYRALSAMASDSPDFVLIHDGARPWVSPELIERVIGGTVEYGACLPVTQPSDALKEVGKAGTVTRHMGRAFVLAAQTPQGFSYAKILQAHRRAQEHAERRFVDDTEIYAQQWGTVYTVAGEHENRKITYRHDVEPA